MLCLWQALQAHSYLYFFFLPIISFHFYFLHPLASLQHLACYQYCYWLSVIIYFISVCDICLVYIVYILFDDDAHHTQNKICIPCLLTHTIIFNKKMSFLWSWRLLIFYLISGGLQLSFLLSFITSVNCKSNLRHSRTHSFASSVILHIHCWNDRVKIFLHPIFLIKNMYIL